MDWFLPLLVGLLGGGTIGVTAAAVLTVSHERAERFRDRQFEAASRFIADYEAALDATVKLWEAMTDLGDAQDHAVEAAGAAHLATADAEFEEAVGIDDVLAELAKAINVGLDLIGRDVSSERAAEEVAHSRALVERAIENLAGRMEEPFASANRDLLRSLRGTSDALSRLLESAKQSRAGLHRLLVSVAQLTLLFADEDAEVVEAARQVAEALVALTSHVLGLALDFAEPEPEQEGISDADQEPDAISDAEQESDRISDEIQDANQLLADFAALVNARVRPRPLMHDLGIGRRQPGASSREVTTR